MIDSNSEIFLNKETPQLLTSEVFDTFIKLEQYELNAIETETKKPISDGLILFYIVKNKLLDNGVKFTSPGNSAKRNFILWYNA